jgi:uncharacterized SAM-binding protein YcdF (DUF218 family)
LAATILLASAASAGALVVPSFRLPFLEAVGLILASDSPLETADIIIVGVGTEGAGVLEAADLVQAGVASRVAVVAEPADPVDQEFARRGMASDDAASRAIRRLRALRIENVERLPFVATGTEDEGRLLAGWCSQRQIRSAVVVTTRDHSRRLGRVLRRSTRNSAEIMVRGSRYSAFDPDQWWRSRAGIRIAIIEIQKLAFDMVRHPVS